MRLKAARGFSIEDEMVFIYIYGNKILRLEGDCGIMVEKEV